jgi:hypothetical protein
MQGTGAAGAQRVIRAAGRQFVKPDSALARTALDLLAAHVADGVAGESALCGHCGDYLPCPTALHARMVVTAAGLDVSVPLRLPDAVIQGIPDGPVERALEITPQRVPDTTVEGDSQAASRDRVGAA